MSENQRGLNQRYEEKMVRQNPFGDTVERNSMNVVNPKRAELDFTARSQKTERGGHGNNPTERRSMCHENV